MVLKLPDKDNEEVRRKATATGPWHFSRARAMVGIQPGPKGTRKHRLNAELPMNPDFVEYARVVKKVLDPTHARTAVLCLTPYVYDRTLWKRMERITEAYANLLEFVFREFPTNAHIQEVLEYPEELERYLESLNIYEKNLAAARIDIFLTSRGPMMCESNCEIPGANEESYFLEQEYLRLLRPRGLKAVPRMEIVYDTLMSYYDIQARFFELPRRDTLNIYLTQWQSEIDRILGEYDIIMNFIRERGHRCRVIDPNRVIIRDDCAYGPDGDRIDLIYRRFTADELPRFARRSWQMAIDWDRAKVAVVNPFCTKRVDSKNIMVLFKDDAYEEVFPPDLKEDLAVVRDIIPWTRKIKAEMKAPDGTMVEARRFLAAQRENLVIKHANAYSSAAVFIGEDLTDERWREVVEESLEGDWIVQEKLELPELELEYLEDGRVKRERCIFNVNPYIYDGRLGGFLNRASTDKLTSFKSGEVATIMPCFESILAGEPQP